MKRIMALMVAGSAAVAAQAQHSLADLPRVGIDLDGWVGGVSQSASAINLGAAYPSAVNSSISDLKAKGQGAMGVNLGVGFFFDKGRHWGIGTGIAFARYKSELGLAQFHTEFKSIDYKNEVFRQIATADGPITEKIASAALSVPVMLKYQTQFSERLGLMVDGGVLLNMSVKNEYTTNASFSYGAVYNFSGADHAPVYDGAPVPDPNSWVITKAAYASDEARFEQLRTQGYSIGNDVKPTATPGSVSFKSGSVGFVLQPALSYRLSNSLFLKVGAIYAMHPFANDASVTYMTTAKPGDYSSLLNGVTKLSNSAYGLNVGLRYFPGRPKDRDHDGVFDRKDMCPDVAGVVQFQGCPDTDNDGIRDADDSCPRIAGILQFNGCPDSDGDGIQDKDDACPSQKGSAGLKGCPDSDGDGIIDREDACPSLPGSAQMKGCPDTDGDGIADIDDKCPDKEGSASNGGCPVPIAEPEPEPEPKIDISSPILFGVGRTTLQKEAYDILNNVAELYNKTPGAYIQIDGYTDNTGSASYNRMLSRKRAQMVKRYLMSKGVSAKQIHVTGHGSVDPQTSNKTKVGRAQNRRVKIALETKSN